MPWAKIDDGIVHRRKVRRLSDAAWRLYLSAIIDTCREGADGVIDAETLSELLPRHHEEHVRALLDAGLLHDGPGCESEHCLSSQGLPAEGTHLYVIHDFHQWQMSSDEWEQKKRENARRGRFGMHKRHHVNAGKVNPDCEFCQEAK